MNVQPFAARLYPHRESREPTLEANLVGNHTLERCGVRAAARDAVAVHVEAHRAIVHRRRAQPEIEPEPFRSKDRKVACGRFEIDRVPECPQRARQHRDADVGPAAARDVLRRRSEEAESQSMRITSIPLWQRYTEK